MCYDWDLILPFPWFTVERNFNIRGLTGAAMRTSIPGMPLFAAVLLILSLSSCEKRDERFSIVNIVKASVIVVKERGITKLSAEAVNEEIEKMYSSPDDILEKKKYLRNRDSDGSNNYRVIMSERIEEERYQHERAQKDPFRK